MEKIVLLCMDAEKHRDLKKCLKLLFPECSIEIMEQRKNINCQGKKGENINAKYFC